MLTTQLSGIAEVEALQQALKNYASILKFPAADPGSISGVVNERTVTATLAVVSTIPSIPKFLKLALTIGAVGTAISNDAFAVAAQVIGDNASTLAIAIDGYAAAQRIGLFNSGSSSAAPSRSYAAGSVARWHRREKVYWIFPPGSPLSGASSVAGLGEVPTPVGKEGVIPPGATRGADIDDPWYKKWYWWTAIGGGAITLGTATYFVARKR